MVVKNVHKVVQDKKTDAFGSLVVYCFGKNEELPVVVESRSLAVSTTLVVSERENTVFKTCFSRKANATISVWNAFAVFEANLTYQNPTKSRAQA